MVRIAILILLAQAPGWAEGEVYRDVEGGLTMQLAGGFRFLKRTGTVTLLGSSETPGVVLIESGESFTGAELAAAAGTGYKAAGVDLTPEGPAARIAAGEGEGLAFPVTGTLEGQRVRGILAGLRAKTGRCFVVLAATTPEAWGKLEGVARRMVEDLRLERPGGTGGDGGVRAYFAGMRLSYYMSRTGTSSTGVREGSFNGVERIYLCGDGRFQYGEQAQGTFDVPQAAGRARTGSSGSGRWEASGSAEGALLVLAFDDGRRLEYRATRLGRDVVYLNGSKYFRAGQAQCP